MSLGQVACMHSLCYLIDVTDIWPLVRVRIDTQAYQVTQLQHNYKLSYSQRLQSSVHIM